MRIRIIYTLVSNPEDKLEDVIRWPDLSSIDEIAPHAQQHLEQKYGSGAFSIVAIEEC